MAEPGPDPERVARITRWLQIVFFGTIIICVAIGLAVGFAEGSVRWGIAAVACAGVGCCLFGSLALVVRGEMGAILRVLKVVTRRRFDAVDHYGD